MRYHLVQPANQPLVIKDQAWFLKCLREILQEEATELSSLHRSFYMLEHK